MGWGTPELPGVDLLVAPTVGEVTEYVRESCADTIHVLGGVRGCAVAEAALRACARHGARYGVLAEGVNDKGMLGILRNAAYRYYSWRYRRGMDFIIAMGSRGVEWYRRVGFSIDRTFPFCYTVESSVFGRVDEMVPGPFRILFLGTLSARKGPDLLIHAVRLLRRRDWTLQVVGDGPMRSALVQAIARAGTSERIRITGYLEHTAAMETLRTSDVLVVPSRYDGWGAAVNEALMVGTPVVCSDCCGARDLIRSRICGDVYDHRDTGALADILDRRMREGRVSVEHRGMIRSSAQAISGEAVAEYFCRIMQYIFVGGMERPVPPWGRQQQL